MNTLEINLLGGFDVRREGVPLSGFYSNKARALLCYVALTQRTHTREALADLLWQDVPETDAKTSLRQVLSNLRKLLGDAVAVTRQTVRIRPNLIILDTQQFTQNDDPSALDLYRGDFLAGFHVDDAAQFEEWALVQRERLRLLAIDRLQQRAEAQQQAGDHADALSSWLRLLEIEPWRESAHLQVMWLFVRQGRLLSALRQFEQCQQLLDAELGVAVSADMSQLAARIEAVRNASLDATPASHAPFFGRQTELAQLSDWLRNPACRLVTLWGAGGLGKTRFASEWARAYRWRFLEGSYFIDLVGVDSPDGLLAAVATALQIETPQVSWALLVRTLAEREALLILDNFEHLVEHAPLIAQLLDAPWVKLLVTSREVLNLSEEWVLALSGLDFPATSQPNAAQQFGALTMLEQMAARQGAQVDWSSARAAALALCRAVDGLPLALELLASATRQQSPSELVVALNVSLDAVQTRFRNWPLRHRSLRAVFEYSWGLLDAAERDCLARLALFVGGFSAEAAASVLPDGAGLIERLLDKSLVQRAGLDRFALHQTIRAYALEQATALGVEQEAGQAQAHFFQNFCVTQYESIVGGVGAQFIGAMGVELANVQAAWTWALANGAWSVLRDVLVTLTEFYEWRGMLTELETQAEAALAVVPPDEPIVGLLRARLASGKARLGQLEAARDLYEAAAADLSGLERMMALNGLSMCCLNSGDFAAAEAAARQAVAAGDGASAALATGHYRLAAALAQQGRLPEAKAAAETSVAMNTALGSDWNLAIAQHELAPILAALGNVPGAEQIFRRNLALTARLGDQVGEMMTCWRLAGLLAEAARVAEAGQALERGLGLARELEDVDGIGRFETALHSLKIT